MKTPATPEPPAKQAAAPRELTRRILAAVVLAPAAILAAWAGGLWFASAVAIAIGIAGYEWTRTCAIDRAAAIALLIVLGPVLALAQTTGGAAASLLILGLAALSALGGQKGTANRLWPLVGVVYLGLPTVAILWVRGDVQFGLAAVLFLFGTVWLSDIGGYICGRTFGGPRLAPAISPAKTWAGAVGGILFAVGGTYAAAELLDAPAPFGAVALAIYLSLATQCGDLFESWVKRQFGKKDAGSIIPGHGGVLDRIDGLLFAAVVLAGVMLAKSGADPSWP